VNNPIEHSMVVFGGGFQKFSICFQL